MFTNGTQPAKVDNSKLTFTSKSDSIATVSADGTITAVAEGDTIVEVVATDKSTLNTAVAVVVS